MELNQNNLDDFVKSESRALVLFYADWCPYCQAFLKIVAKDKAKLKNELHLADISDEDNPLWERLQIDVVPTLISYRDGVQFEKREAPYRIGLKEKDLLEMDAQLAGQK